MRKLDLTIPPRQRDETTGTTVFLLGAGCSADAGCPVMLKFMEKARQLARAPDCPFREDYERAFNFRNECMRISYILERWWENIEEIYTQAHLRQIIKTEDAESLVGSLRRVIWDVYRRKFVFNPGMPQGYWIFAGVLNSFLDLWLNESRPRPVVITTNYDVRLECAMIGCFIGRDSKERRPLKVVYPGLPGDRAGYFLTPESGLMHRVPGRDYGEEMRAIEIIKLHGSVNWFNDSKGELWFPVGTEARGNETHLTCQTDEFAHSMTSEPLIVPPLLGKAEAPPMIVDQWKAAIHAISHARELVIAGYSFPDSDAFMTRLISEGFKEKCTIERIYIVNPDANERWWNRVELLFSRTWWRSNVQRCVSDFGQFALQLQYGNVSNIAEVARLADIDTRIKKRAEQ